MKTITTLRVASLATLALFTVCAALPSATSRAADRPRSLRLVVCDPVGQPARRATVALVPDEKTDLRWEQRKGAGDGEARRVLKYGGPAQEWSTDGAGEASNPFPRRFDNLFIWNDTGYFAARLGDVGARAEVQLRPWRSIRGRVLIGDEPAPEGTVVALSGPVFTAPADSVPYLDTARTGAGGAFAFDRVPTGRFQISRWSTDSPFPLPSHPVYVDVADADVEDVTVGAGGTTVTGSLSLPEGAQGEVRVVRLFPRERDAPGFYPAMYVGRVEADGGFRIDHVPSGEYALTASVRAPGQQGDVGLRSALANVPIRVPAKADDGQRALELGRIQLRPLTE